MAACLCLLAESAFMQTKPNWWTSDETVSVHGEVGCEALLAMHWRRSTLIMQTELIRWKNRDALTLNNGSIDFHTPASCLLQSGEKRYARYALCATEISVQLRAVDDALAVSEGERHSENHGMTNPFVIAADAILQFLREGQNAV
jgi:hypothetical protein